MLGKLARFFYQEKRFNHLNHQKQGPRIISSRRVIGLTNHKNGNKKDKSHPLS